MGFDYARDAGGIVTVTMDMDGQSANTMSPAYRDLMGATVARLQAETGLTGVILASAKKTFFAGGDLNGLLVAEAADDAYRARIDEEKGFLRRLEQLAVPVVAAINGAAVGGGYEICLACNHRILLDDPSAITGLPEVTLGLLPGAGGVARLPRRIGLEPALDLLLTGRTLPPREALALGLVDRLVATRDDLIPAARDWIRANPGAHRQPWDAGAPHAPDRVAARAIIAQARAEVARRTRGKLPAPMRILDIVEAGLELDIDATLALETRLFATLPGLPETRAAISTNFFAANAVRSGKLRPAGPRSAPGPVAVIGAGAAIAAMTTGRGLPTQVVEPGATLTDPAPGIIIEAVAEDADLKHATLRDHFAALAPDGIWATTAATIPVATLAHAAPDPGRVLGLHFCGAEGDMPLVEIVPGPLTTPDTTRRAYDFVQSLRKTPIIVGDAPGFFVARVQSASLSEGRALLADGMDAAAIEQVALDAGLPASPVAGAGPVPNGSRHHPIDGAEAADRMLYVQAIETLRCLNEGVLRTEAEANLGSILGFGFPAYTGGALQFIRGVGIDRFAARAAQLADRWGDRFAVPDTAYDILRSGRVKVA